MVSVKSSTNSTEHRPPDKKTPEATGEGLRLAKEAGDTYLKMVDYFLNNVAQCGAKQRAGEYLIGFAVEHAEPLYHLMGGELKLAEPAGDDNAHLEVVVVDGSDNRFVPELHVEVTLSDEGGKEVGTYHLPFLWHPTMYHYGCNVHIPSKGHYTARVAIPVPSFPRHDKVNGKRYTSPVTAEFHNVEIDPGRK